MRLSFTLTAAIFLLILLGTWGHAFAQGTGAIDAQLGVYNAPAPTTQQSGFVPLSDANFSNLFGDSIVPSAGEIGSGGLAKFLNSAFKVAISVGAILAVIRIAWAGYLYMGDDMWGHKSKAREILGDVVIGVLLLLAIWLILNQINPDLLKLDFLRNVKPLQNAPAQTGQTGAQICDGTGPCN